MGVDAAHAIEELVAYCLAGDGSAGAKNLRNRAGMLAGGLLRREPIRTAAAGPRTGDVVHILDHRREASKRPVLCANNRRVQIMRDEKRISHAACFLYQSRMRAPSHAATPGLLNTSSKARRTWAIRCGIPDR